MIIRVVLVMLTVTMTVALMVMMPISGCGGS